MQEIVAQVLLILRGAWRFRWLGVAVAWLVAIAGWISVQFIPDVYESRTQVYVDTDSLLKPLLTGLAVNQDVMSQVAMMQTVMLSRPNLEKVANKNDLLLKAKTQREAEMAIDDLARKIDLRRPSGVPSSQNTFVVSYESDDPEVAHGVVRSLLDTFMEGSLGMKRSDAGVAQRFLLSQLADYEKRLTEAEQRLAAFKQQNVGLLPGFGGDYYQRLESEMGTLQQMQQRIAQMVQRRNELQRQLEGEEPTFGLMGSPEGSPIDGQIARYRAQLDQLLLQYTEKHPQVQAIQQTIDQLEQEKRSGAKLSTSVAPPGATVTGDQALVRSLDMNPVYQNLRLSLSQTDADIAELRGQMAAQQAVVADLRSKVNSIPQVEAELARLNRDYEVNKEQYDTLLQRLESAKISEQADQNTENVKFRIIEPPTVPVKPSGPVRPLLNTMVLLAALGAALGIAVMFAQLHPTFATRETLQRVANVPVLGTISTVISEVAMPWYRRQGAMIVGAAGLLLMAYVVNIVLTEPIRALIRGITG
jgi:polysaccharide chain length determinant protein (PEP-CTERM system associated)